MVSMQQRSTLHDFPSSMAKELDKMDLFLGRINETTTGSRQPGPKIGQTNIGDQQVVSSPNVTLSSNVEPGSTENEEITSSRSQKMSDSNASVRISHRYKDFSMLEDPNPNVPVTKPGRVARFQAKLYAILSRTDLQDIISWMPHGRAWKVHKPREFEVKVLPVYFEHSKFSSFIRQANGWGFRRMSSSGPDRNCYYHELFLRGKPHLLKLMKRCTTRSPPLNRASSVDPDFYQVAVKRPLPEAHFEEEYDASVRPESDHNISGQSSRLNNVQASYYHSASPAEAQPFFLPPLTERTTLVSENYSYPKSVTPQPSMGGFAPSYAVNPAPFLPATGTDIHHISEHRQTTALQYQAPMAQDGFSHYQHLPTQQSQMVIPFTTTMNNSHSTRGPKPVGPSSRTTCTSLSFPDFESLGRGGSTSSMDQFHFQKHQSGNGFN